MFLIQYDKSSFVDADKITTVFTDDDDLFFTVEDWNSALLVRDNYRNTFLNNLQCRNEGFINIQSTLKKEVELKNG